MKRIRKFSQPDRLDRRTSTTNPRSHRRWWLKGARSLLLMGERVTVSDLSELKALGTAGLGGARVFVRSTRTEYGLSRWQMGDDTGIDWYENVKEGQWVHL